MSDFFCNINSKVRMSGALVIGRLSHCTVVPSLPRTDYKDAHCTVYTVHRWHGVSRYMDRAGHELLDVAKRR